MTKKGSMSVLFFYGLGLVIAGAALVVRDVNVAYSALIAVGIGLGFLGMIGVKPIGWMGMTKERTN